jgi:hypothetical protein
MRHNIFRELPNDDIMMYLKDVVDTAYAYIISCTLKFQSPLLLAQETGSAHDETSSSGNKEDEDDDEDEGEDKIDPQQYDPERLKAFNVSNTRNLTWA